MGELGNIEGDSADTTVAYDQAVVDPDYNSSEIAEPSRIWIFSQSFREIMDSGGLPAPDDRKHLADGVLRQLQTLALYREVKLAKDAARQSGKKQQLTLYVLLFPGEARDNTGIKDLNDKVLGYKVNSGYIEKRQEAIATLFWDQSSTSGPRYITVGQDYKTASIIAYEKKREDFAKDLIKLDAKLRDELLAALDLAEPDAQDSKQLAEIRKLRKTLKKNAKYKFDLLFGTDVIDPSAQRSDIDAVFLMLTEALKAAGVARYLVKKDNLRDSNAKKVASGAGVSSDNKKLDTRGKAFALDEYRRTTLIAEKIKKLVSAGYHRDAPQDYQNIFVDTVWTVAFLTYRKLWFGNPDVIRDVRKRLLVPPKMTEGTKYNLTGQRELLELWLVSLNELDFVKDFLLTEFRSSVVKYHDLCYQAFKDVRDTAATPNWEQLRAELLKVFIHDHRFTEYRFLVQGTTSEYQFYAYAADWTQQIFFTMDIRDLGVELLAWYELFSEAINEDKLSGVPLLEATIESTEPIIMRKRAAYEAVVVLFQYYYRQITNNGGEAGALKAFGGVLLAQPPLPPFDQCVQILLGGDEIFVAAHPYFARYVTEIVAKLAKTEFKSSSKGREIGARLLNMRTSVAYSSAKAAQGGVGGMEISKAQRLSNQLSHDNAMKLGNNAASALKPLERAQRRMERLIDMLEGNDKKKKLAPNFAAQLDKLGLMTVYVQVLYAHPALSSQAEIERVLDYLSAGDLVAATGTKLVDLVDFSGNIVDAKKLLQDRTKLEDAIRKEVGWDNYHQDGPPVTKMPKLIEIILDWLLPKDGDTDKKKKKKP